MSKANDRVIDCWLRGKCAYRSPRGHSPFFTDGRTIYSYNSAHPIAHRAADGMLYVLGPHMEGGYVSVTTKGQVMEVASAVGLQAYGGPQGFGRTRNPTSTLCAKSFGALVRILNKGCAGKDDWFACPGEWGPPKGMKFCEERQKALLGGAYRVRRRRARR